MTSIPPLTVEQIKLLDRYVPAHAKLALSELIAKLISLSNSNLESTQKVGSSLLVANLEVRWVSSTQITLNPIGVDGDFSYWVHDGAGTRILVEDTSQHTLDISVTASPDPLTHGIIPSQAPDAALGYDIWALAKADGSDPIYVFMETGTDPSTIAGGVNFPAHTMWSIALIHFVSNDDFGSSDILPHQPARNGYVRFHGGNVGLFTASAGPTDIDFSAGLPSDEALFDHWVCTVSRFESASVRDIDVDSNGASGVTEITLQNNDSDFSTEISSGGLPNGTTTADPYSVTISAGLTGFDTILALMTMVKLTR